MFNQAVSTESLFQTLLESAPDAVVIVNHEGQIVLINDQTTKLFGYQREELIGSTVEELLPDGVRHRHENHRRGYVAQPHTRPMGTGLHLEAKRKDGSTFPVEVSLSATQTEQGYLVTSVIRDVTERQRAALELERKVLQRTAHLNTLLELSRELFGARRLDSLMQRVLNHVRALAPDLSVSAIYLYDPQRHRLALRAYSATSPTLTLRNSLVLDQSLIAQVFAERLSFESTDPAAIAELLDEPPPADDPRLAPHGVFLLPLATPERIEGLLVLGYLPLAQSPFSAEICQTLDGLATLTTAALGEERNTLANASLSDTVARLEAQHRSLTARLDTAEAGMLQAARLAAVGQLAASVAHEINNPLYAARNCLYLLEEDLPAHLRDAPYLRIARDELSRIAQIIQRMRDFYRPNRSDFSSCDVNHLVEETLALARLNIRDAQISVIFAPATELPAITADGDQLRQVFLNLTLNAIDAMGEEGTLTVRTTVQGEFVTIEIHDTGPGIPDELRERIFEPFFTTKSNGTGLGLSISAHIVTQHNGRILVESLPSEGTMFQVILPQYGGEQ